MTSGWWSKGDLEVESGSEAVKRAIARVTRPVYLLDLGGRVGVGRGGKLTIGGTAPNDSDCYPLLAFAPALHPRDLGDPGFKTRHRIRYAYIAGAMANGITSVDMVEAAGRAGMIGFFGAGGLSLREIEHAIDTLKRTMGSLPFGFNLIHSPGDPAHEAAVVDLYLRREIRLISASAYMDLTLPLVYYRVKGIHRVPSGDLVCPNRVIAKVSRVEVAGKFLAPPPEKMLSQLVDRKMITPVEASEALRIPMADDLTAEADSGGHTDNRPAISLLPTMISLRDALAEKYAYPDTPCVGLAGGIATPEATAGAFAMGAAFVLTGSINQSCAEAGISKTVRRMLSEAGQADVTMAPAADMFEMGVKVQVLKRGTMFPFRAAKLYDIYMKYPGLEHISEKERSILERDLFRCTLQEEWDRTRAFFADLDPGQIERAENEPKHRMALVFRSYLGRSSKWAVTGDPERTIDYQIWCGPSIGAFNEWAKGSFLEKPENRKTVDVAMNLLTGAAVATRANWLRNQNVPLPRSAGKFIPHPLEEIYGLIGSS
jgi:PfaD family protein